MEALAIEVLYDIFAYLENDIHTLKSLRLASKKLESAAVEHLFRTLLVYQHKDSWEKLNQVARCSHLATLPRKLAVASLTYLPSFSSYEKWLEKRDEYFETYIQAHRPAVDSSVMSDHYAKYTYWQEGEKTIHDACFDYVLDIPTLELEKLPRLKAIETVDSLHLWGEHWSSMPDPDRRQQDCLIPSYWCQKADAAHLTLVFYQSCIPSGHIESLTLRQYVEVIKSPFPNSLGVYTIGTLELDLHFILLSCREEEAMLEWQLADWMTHARGLHTFKLRQDPHYGSQINVVRMLREVQWPKLRNARFEEVATRPKHIREFLQKHGASLRTLEIIDPYLIYDEWRRLSSYLDETCLRLYPKLSLKKLPRILTEDDPGYW